MLGIAFVVALSAGVLSAAFVAPGAANTTSATASTSTVGEANVTIANQTTNGTTVIVRSATLPEGGFIAIHNDSYLPPSNDSVGSTIGVSRYLSAGSHQRVEVVLDEPIAENQTLVATAARDGNSNQSFDYLSSQGFIDTAYSRTAGGAVDDRASVRIVNATSLAREAKIGFPNQSTTGATVTVQSVTLPDGGFVGIHGENYLPPNNETQDSLRGFSGYLTPGTHRNVSIALKQNVTENTILLAIPYRDTNRNQSFDYLRSNGENDTAYAPRGATALVSRGSVTVEQTPETNDSGATTRSTTESSEESSSAGLTSLFQSLEIVVIIAMVLVTYLYFRLT
ncbi:hypothetical protein D3261_09000 [Halococcus sp. IIIV-5B]|nr:hypothetical protein D3261_09000 [Halococcus sp. IIIV-5B]